MRYQEIFRYIVQFMVLLSAANSFATLYYVRTGGSDLGTGTSAGDAWQTVQKAANSMISGDTVYVGAGTYAQSVSISVSGTSVSLISYVADTTGVHTGDSGTVKVQPASGHGFSFAAGTDGIVIDGFDVTAAGAAACGILANNLCDDIIVRNCEVYGCATKGIAFGNSTSLQAHCKNILIENNVVYGNGSHGINQYGATGSLGYSTVRGNTVYSNTGQGIRLERVGGNGTVLVERNVVMSNVSHGIQFPGLNGTVVIRNNVVYGHPTGGAGTEAIDLNSITSCTVVNNTCYIGRKGVEMNTAGTYALLNNIFDGFTAASVERRDASVISVFDYNCYTGSLLGGSFPSAANNMTSAPLFADPDGADNVLGGTNYADDDFRLQQISPCVDAAADTSINANVPSNDVAGESRPYDVVSTDGNGALAEFDIGADEWNIGAPVPVTLSVFVGE
jgi:parallel beta-helix repeat protein